MYIKETFYDGIYLEKELHSKNKILENVEVEYYKIKNDDEYGFEIIKKENKNNIINLEIAKVEYFSSDELNRNKMLEKMSRNQVTPISLQYILEDMGNELVVKYSFK